MSISKYVILILLSFLCMSRVKTAGTPIYQAIWVVEEGVSSPSTTLDWSNQYLLMRTKFFSSGSLLTNYIIPGTPLMSIKRSNDGAFTQINSYLNDGNKKYQFFIPKIDLTHDSMSFVIYEVTANSCVTTDANDCYIEYKIKFFKCNTIAQKFYNNQNTQNAYISPSNSMVSLLNDFPDSYLEDLLLGKNELKCQIKTNTSCCLPYSCLIDSSSIQCICSLEGNSPSAPLSGVCEEYYDATTPTV